MIGYATIGTNDFERARAFYDQVFAPLGGRRIFMLGETMQFYASREIPGMIAITTPYDKQPAQPSNGGMFGLSATSREQVEAVYEAALAAGATCEGKPGDRTDTFYGAYFRDLDGNKLCVFHLVRKPKAG